MNAPSIHAVPKPLQYMILSALGFSLMCLFVKLSAARGIPVIEILAARALVSLVLSYAILKSMHIPVFGHNKPLLLLRGILGFITLNMVYYSVTHLPLGLATVIQFLNPVFTACIGLALLREAIDRGVAICICLSITGTIILSIPVTDWAPAASSFSGLALAMALGGAIMSGFCYVVVRQLAKTEDPLVIVFYFPLVALPAAIPFLWQHFVIPDIIELCYLLLVGVMTQIGQVYLTKALQIEAAGKATAYAYLQIPFAGLWGYLFLSEVPTRYTVVGALFILGGAYCNIALKPKHRAHEPQSEAQGKTHDG